MTAHASCLLYTSDTPWATRIGAFLSPLMLLHPFGTPPLLQGFLEQHPASLVLLDLQTTGALDLLSTLSHRYPNTLVIVFGTATSDPMLEAARQGVYALEASEVSCHRLTHLVQQALAHLELAAENRLLRQETLRLNAITEVAHRLPQPDTDSSLDIRDFSAALRHFTHVETLLHRLVDEVAGSLRVSRVGIFCRTRDVASYRLRAGLRCLESTSSLEYSETHPQVLWLANHSHAVTRTNLTHVRNPTTRLMLQDLLDQMGAEILIPLQSRDRIMGWLFVGHLATGLPFDDRHLHKLITLTECVSTTLENALLYEEITIQKTLAETLLHSIPNGIIAVDDDGIVRWYNDTAQSLLGIQSAVAVGRPIEGLGGRLADLLRRTLGESGSPQSAEWMESSTQRSFTARTRRLSSPARCLGAVVVVQDITDQKNMKEKEDRLDRATFWAELAASMSHEVRNPLVAIKTFAQLLPERYQDTEFQHEFKDLVSSEVERLNSIVDQIHAFAHPPALSFKAIQPQACIASACARVFPTEPPSKIRVTVSAPDTLPAIQGDDRALIEAFTHILTNSKEALAATPNAEITLTLRLVEDPGQTPAITLVFKDNGPGIAPDMLDKLFSPFSTTKARGLGLGLPIVRRTILDHSGTITVNSNEFGVLITIRLPLLLPKTGSPS
jgi:nitrogen-specific signal transduction histidine kinase